MKKIFLIHLIVIIVSKVLAQGYIPPSPNAVALSKYANVPINLATGTAEISVPLYSFDYKEMSIPVSINYYASGIKVQDIASWVGSGWSLAAGGVITRTVKGIPDEEENGFCGINQRGLSQADNIDYLGPISRGEWDGEPDIFYFNFLGTTGKFVLDAAGRPYIIPARSDIHIEPAIGIQGTGKWVLTDGNGVKYIFGKDDLSREITTTELEENEDEDNIKSFVSSWYLNEVILSNNLDKIEFEYTSGNEVHYKYYYQHYLKNFYYNSHIPNGTEGDLCDGPESKMVNENRLITISNPKYLSKIISPLGKVEFNSIEGRLDVGGRFLDKIQVSNVNSTLVKKLKLNYDYFYSAIDCQNNRDCYRLKLLSVYDETASSFKVASFGYHEVQLPARNSPKYDHWGYYNNNLHSNDIPPYQSEGVNYPGANKSPDNNKMKANILVKIENGTGGIREFSYEPHYYRYNNTNVMAGGLRIQQIKDVPGNGSLAIVKTYSYSKENEANVSSGHIKTLPLYVSEVDAYTYMQCQIYNCAYCYRKYIKSSSSSEVELFDINGSHISYSTVTETQADGGKIIYNYRSFEDTPDIISEQFKFRDGYGVAGTGSYTHEITPLPNNGAPFTPTTYMGYSRGLLKEMKIYASGNKLRKFLSYEYLMPPAIIHIPAYSAKSTFSYGGYNNIQVGKYKIVSQPVFIKNVVERQYDENNVSKVTVTTTDYIYNSRNQLSETITKDGLNFEYTSKFRYPQDYPYVNRNAAVNNMVDRHIISPVIEQKVSIKKGTTEKVVSADLSEYKMDGSLIVPGKTFSFRSNDGVTDFINSNLLANGALQYDTRYQMETTFTDYDTDGNILDVSAHDGVRTSYIWGYDGAYPIAKVTNAAPNEVAYTSFEDETAKGGWSFTYKKNDISPCTAQYSIDYNACQQIPGSSPDYATCMNKMVADFEACKSTIENTYTIKSSAGKAGKNAIQRAVISKSNLPAGNYVVSFWARKVDVNSDGSISGSVSVSNFETEWKLYKFILTNVTSVSISVSPNVLLDELRLHPVDAQMTTYTYDPLIGVTSASDENNNNVNYTYDDLGRLSYVKDHKGNIVKQYEYHYKE